MKFNVNIATQGKPASFIIEAADEEAAGEVASAFLKEHYPATAPRIRSATITPAPDDAEVSTGINQ